MPGQYPYHEAMGALTPEELTEKVGQEVAKCPGVAAAWLFGSLARGEARSDSDLDLAVLLDASAEQTDPIPLLDLSAALERYSPSGRVDLVVLGSQGPVFRQRVLHEGKVVHDAAPAQRIAFEGRTISDYLDWKPTHEIAMQVVFDGLRRRFAQGGS